MNFTTTHCLVCNLLPAPVFWGYYASHLKTGLLWTAAGSSLFRVHILPWEIWILFKIHLPPCIPNILILYHTQYLEPKWTLLRHTSLYDRVGDPSFNTSIGFIASTYNFVFSSLPSWITAIISSEPYFHLCFSFHRLIPMPGRMPFLQNTHPCGTGLFFNIKEV